MQRLILDRLAVTILSQTDADHRNARYVVVDGLGWDDPEQGRIYGQAQVRHYRRLRAEGYGGHASTPPGELLTPEDGGVTTLMLATVTEPEATSSLVPARGDAPVTVHHPPDQLPAYRVTLANAPAAVARLVAASAADEGWAAVALHGWTRIPEEFGIDLGGLPPWMASLWPKLTLPTFTWGITRDGVEKSWLQWRAASWDGRLELPYDVVLSGTAGAIVSSTGLTEIEPPAPHVDEPAASA